MKSDNENFTGLFFFFFCGMTKVLLWAWNKSQGSYKKDFLSFFDPEEKHGIDHLLHIELIIPVWEERVMIAMKTQIKYFIAFLCQYYTRFCEVRIFSQWDMGVDACKCKGFLGKNSWWSYTISCGVEVH